MSKSHISISVSINKNEKENKKKQLEDVKKQKQELIKKFRKKNKEFVKKQNDLSNINNVNNEVVAEQVYIKRTNEQKINKKIQELEKKLKATQQENLKLRTREKNLKKEGYIIKKTNNELKDEIHQIKKSIDEKNLKIKELLAEIDYLTSPNEIVIHQSKRITKLNERIQHYKNKAIYSAKLVDKMKLKINNAKSLGKLTDVSNYKEKYEEIYIRYHNLKKVINTLKQVNQDIVEKYELNKTLLLLELWMRFSYRNKLPRANKQEIFIKNEKALFSTKNIIQIEEIKEIYQTTQKVKKDINVQYGYLFIEKDLFYVKTLNNDIYLIINPKKCIDTLPCKIQIIKNKAVLLKIYKDSNADIIFNNIKEKNKSKEKSNDSELKKLLTFYKKQFDNITVLIVGSKYKNIYVSVLSQCGINVIWHDSFEESEFVLNSKIKGSDIVVVCADHVFHRVLDFIEDNDKFQVVYNDTVTTILARIKFALIAMGKL